MNVARTVLGPKIILVSGCENVAGKLRQNLVNLVFSEALSNSKNKLLQSKAFALQIEKMI